MHECLSFFFFVSLSFSTLQTHPEESLAVELDVVVILILVVAKGPGDEGEGATPRERRRRRRETAATRNRWRHRTNSGLFFLLRAAAGHRAAARDASLRAREPRGRNEGSEAGTRGGGQPREGPHFVSFFSSSFSRQRRKTNGKKYASGKRPVPSERRLGSTFSDLGIWVSTVLPSRAFVHRRPPRTRIGPVLSLGALDASDLSQ